MRLHRSSPAALLVAAATSVLATIGVAAPAAASTVTLSTASDPVAAPGGVAGTDTVVSMTVDGLARSYRLFVPTNLPTGPRPLLVMLHGLDANATLTESASNFDAGAAANGVLVAYPDGVSSSWNAGTCCGTARSTGVDDVGFLDSVLDDVGARYSVDTTRIAVGGFSNGGMMSYRYACERSTRVQTVFVGSGVGVEPSCQFAAPMAILHMHGLKDTLIPWNGTKTSTLTPDGRLPSIPGSTSSFATLDGCSGWTTTKASSLVTKYVANACPTGASVTVMSSSSLAHKWVTGSTAKSTYGMDETGTTWSFVLNRWK